MNKLLKKISKFCVFIYLIIAFSVVIWALSDIYGDPVISKWIEGQDGTVNININNKDFKNLQGTYNKVNESYTVSLDTFGYIGTSDTGTPTEDYDTSTGITKQLYTFDIDNDGNNDYKLAIDIWKVTMPLNVLITVIPNYENATILSPSIELVNQGELDANVFIREMRVLEEDNNIKFVANKSDIDNSVGEDKKNNLYLAVNPADSINNGFEFEESSLANRIVNKDDNTPPVTSNNPMIKLGTLESVNGKISTGRFKFSGKAKKEFLAEHTTVLNNTNASNTNKPYIYKLSYRFKRVPVEKPDTN